MKTFGIGKDGKPELDEMDKETVRRVLNMRCESFFYTMHRVLDEYEIEDEWIDFIDAAVKGCTEATLSVASAVSKEAGSAEASLFLSAFMADMCLEIMDLVSRSDIIREAENVLEGGEE